MLLTFEAHWFEVFDLIDENRSDAWCKHCNCTLSELNSHFSRTEFHDFVVSHGLGAPVATAYPLALQLLSSGMGYAEVAAEIVARDLIDEEL